MFENGSYWRPPVLNPYTQGMPEALVGEKADSKKGQLSERFVMVTCLRANLFLSGSPAFTITVTI